MKSTATDMSLEERTHILTKGYVAKPSQLKTAGIQYELLEGLTDSQGRNYAISKQKLPENFKVNSDSIDYERPFVEVKYKEKTYKLVATNSDIKKAYDKARNIASVIDGKVLNLEGIYQRQIKRVLEDKVRENKAKIIEEIKEKSNPTKNIEIKDKNGVVYGTIDTKIQIQYQGRTHTYELTNEDKIALKNRIMIGEQFEILNELGKKTIVKKVLDKFVEETINQLRKKAGINETEKVIPKSNPNLDRARQRLEKIKNPQTLTQKFYGGLKKLFGSRK